MTVSKLVYVRPSLLRKLSDSRRRPAPFHGLRALRPSTPPPPCGVSASIAPAKPGGQPQAFGQKFVGTAAAAFNPAAPQMILAESPEFPPRRRQRPARIILRQPGGRQRRPESRQGAVASKDMPASGGCQGSPDIRINFNRNTETPLFPGKQPGAHPAPGGWGVRIQESAGGPDSSGSALPRFERASVLRSQSSRGVLPLQQPARRRMKSQHPGFQINHLFRFGLVTTQLPSSGFPA